MPIAYNENMAKFLGTHEIRQGMVKDGLAQWYKPGEAPAGWTELKGAGVERVPKGPKSVSGKIDYNEAIFGDDAPKADPMAGRRERTAPTPIARCANRCSTPRLTRLGSTTITSPRGSTDTAHIGLGVDGIGEARGEAGFQPFLIGWHRAGPQIAP